MLFFVVSGVKESKLQTSNINGNTIAATATNFMIFRELLIKVLLRHQLFFFFWIIGYLLYGI